MAADSLIEDKAELLGKPKTSGYVPVDTRWFRRPRDLPVMTWLVMEQMLMEPTIRLGLAMRAAPLMGCEFAYKKVGGEEWTEGVQANSREVGAFVYRQMKRIWRDLDGLLLAQIWGWSACEVMYCLTDTGTVEVDRLLPRHPRDVRALVREGEICGVRFMRLQGGQEENDQGFADVPFPKSIFHRHKPQPGRYYGQTILEGAYSPWFDKWGAGGALESRRLCMQQNAISGRKLYYPNGEMELPIGANGSMVSTPNRDVARMILEQLMAGGVLSIPSDRDDKGNRLWELEEAKAMDGLQHLLQYPKDLDVEMLRGMEIPDDILTAEATGAWEGKKVPMMAFYSGLDGWLGSLVRDVRQQVIDPLVALNFGPQWFEVTTKPLAEQAMDQAKAGEPQQAPRPEGVFGMPAAGSGEGGGERGYERMSLDPVAAVGQGVLSAAELVQAAKETLFVRMAAEQLRSPKGGVTIKGTRYPGGEFIPKEVLAKLSDADRQRIKSGVYNDVARGGGKSASPAKRVAPKPLSDKAARAKAAHHLIDKDVQRYAEEHNEPAFAKAVGGVSFPDGEPIDVAIAGESGQVAHGIELKTMVDNKANKITMKREAMERKAKWERKNKAPIHTVVIDDSAVFNAKGSGKHDLSKRRIFYRRGYGSFRVNTMHEVADVNELKTLMNLPNRSLPPAAQRPAGQKPGRLAA